MASTTLATRKVLNLPLTVFRGDDFPADRPGIYIAFERLAGESVTPVDLSKAEFCCQVYENKTQLITSLNVEAGDPPYENVLRLWMTASQTALLTKTINPDLLLCGCNAKDYSVYSYSVQVRERVEIGSIVSLINGRVTTIVDHGLVPTSRVSIVNSSLNINNTVYSTLTINTSNSFTIPAIAAQTALGTPGTLQLVKQKTLIQGAIIAQESKGACW